MSDRHDQASDKTVEAAQSLWGVAVTLDASPERTIKASQGTSPSSTATRFQPRPRQLAKRQESSPEADNLDFELGHLLGRGGMGMVYAARQTSLDREIAVKMINGDSAENPDAVNKFLSEAVVTGRLDHPNIVPVYDVGGTADGTMFYAMKEVSGTAWDQSIRTLSLTENLRILLAVCDAVAFAHDKGIIHRDLKPENVMLGNYGETLLMDWGLAVQIEGKDAQPLSAESGLAGTPAYMAPEMANCEIDKIGYASDVYLLGAILYEIVTARRPHSGANVFATISAAMCNAIAPPDTEGELIDIALTAMATEPTDRHGSAKAFQQAVRHYQEHAESLSICAACDQRLATLLTASGGSVYREANEIIAGYQQALTLWPGNERAMAGLRHARTLYIRTALQRDDLTLAGSQLSALETEAETYPHAAQGVPSPAELRAELQRALAKAAARERLIHISTAVAVLAAMAVVAISAGAYFVTRKQRDAAQVARAAESVQRKEAQHALRQAEEAHYYNQIALAQRDLSQDEPRRAEALLRGVPPRLRQWEWGALAYLCRRELMAIHGEFTTIRCMAFDPTGEFIVTADLNNKVILWNAWTGQPAAAIASELDGILALTCTPSARQILVIGRDGILRTWDPRAAREIHMRQLSGFPSDHMALACSPDGRHLAALSRRGTVSVWNTAQETPVRAVALDDDIEGVDCMALPNDIAHIATGADDGAIRWYDLASGQCAGELRQPDPAAPLASMVFAADGRHIAAGTADRRIQVWDTQTRRLRLHMAGHGAAVTALAFSPDGRRLASAGTEPEIKIWDAVNDREFLTLRGREGAITAVTFAPTGAFAAIAGDDGTVCIRDPHTWKSTQLLRGHSGPVLDIAFDRTGTRLATAGHDGTARIWDPRSGAETVRIDHPQGPVTTVSFAADGRRMLTCAAGSVRIWNAATGQRIAALNGGAGTFQVARFSPTGKTFLTAGGHITLWDGETGAQLNTTAAPSGPIQCAAFSPDGSCFVTGDQEAGRLWRTGDGQSLQVLRAHASAVSCVTFSADGKRVLTGSRQGATLWNAENGRELLSFSEHDDWITSAAFSPEGRCLLTGGNDQTARLYMALDWSRSIESLHDWKRDVYRIWARANRP